MPESERTLTVVGVVPDTRYRDLRDARPSIYFSLHQSFFPFAPMTLAIGTSGPPADLVPAIRRVVDATAPGVALAAVGLYGVMASAVRERTREIGVRAVLGATPERLRREVLGQALTTSGAGVLVGLVGALAGSRLFASLLFEVSPTDPVALLGACGWLLTAALLATFLPARRATRIDPAQALRAE